MPDGFTLEDELTLAGRLADAAWIAIRPHFRALKGVDNKAGGPPAAQPAARPQPTATPSIPAKAPFDPVTEADRAAERAIRAILEAERPHHGVTGEEYPETPSSSGYRWLIDPVDGTRAFIAGLPVWTTLISLVGPDDVPLIGVIDQPVLGERYLGWPGGAALVKDGTQTPIRVSACSDLREATIATTDAFMFNPAEQGAWTHLRATARITRYGLDAYAYARLAGGTIDLVAESGLKAWDVAALIPVVRGAGGIATDWRGNEPKLGGQIVCASSDGVMEQALLALRRSATLA
ncbi:inositol monophosphatase family protein [Hyphomonas johnsonii]|uniref:Inositol monophosphatase family protein n=1 Tax=Hyphomonas johnsonii MHS-2 TaxID=1280950 RepID=A0A059FHE1_9PROT|nr:inositol monophosphatase family protein [Hyphomonas johnsonii]KCZ90039.1 inositol monophosphatase family protein [Hyphomonas johnsonii MHS-2]